MARSRVTIVDDDPQARESLAFLLSTADIDSEEFASAEEFLEFTPDIASLCLVLDNRLPGMSGLELLERFAARNEGAAIVMMTGHGDIPTAVAAMKAGAFHFVEKPYDSEAMLAIVQEALSRAERSQDSHAEAELFGRRLNQLTQRERQVYDLLLEGHTSKAIAARLDITLRTADHHRGAILQKFEVRSLSHLMRMALPGRR